MHGAVIGFIETGRGMALLLVGNLAAHRTVWVVIAALVLPVAAEPLPLGVSA